jgi:metal-responsive CopG/Arc/MetJ family transcriptional regulator
MRKKYTNVGIPEELAKEIDVLIKKLNLGFRSRAEFVVEAIRQKIEHNKEKKKK